ncbi:poly(A)-specific ribonuclease complex subunit Pan3 [Schizosaccharomyces japonicus yFS275]|uniref:Poly(A)-specific ribonuclease complex subunit Pan3 n=1 Tax=Schizosaccharomyces japonicus (strain yFS275 / FY16936) TaxID=402676 RepID=B6JZ84_SCHJY|nr:poly(A)-specific ribonuclease complex subunit Pan3 [Schizosaccharomyces japonicus yFS275]EEB06852.1 poly(A)-specific ribonuclease complex subunit Pan3 [Schizosaccharomyces japonicus yFS275]
MSEKHSKFSSSSGKPFLSSTLYSFSANQEAATGSKPTASVGQLDSQNAGRGSVKTFTLSRNRSTAKLSAASPSFTPSSPTKKSLSPTMAKASAFVPKGKLYSSTLFSADKSKSSDDLVLPRKLVIPEFRPSMTSEIASASTPALASTMRSPSTLIPQQRLSPGSLRNSLVGNGAVSISNATTAVGTTVSEKSPSPKQIPRASPTVLHRSGSVPRGVDTFSSQHVSAGGPDVYATDLTRHIYAQFPPYSHRLDKRQLHKLNFFVANEPEKLFRQARVEALQYQESSQLPQQIFTYHSFVPRRTITPCLPNLGYTTHIYKGVNGADGKSYIFVRLQNFRLAQERSISNVTAWMKVDSPAVLRMKEAFTTRAFSDQSIVFVYDFFPACPTLHDLFFSSPVFRKKSSQLMHPTAFQATNEVLWCFASQLVSALYSIHSVGVAARLLTPKNVLMTGKMRLSIFGMGVLDVICDDGTPVHVRQREDFHSLGLLLLSLACGVDGVNDENKEEYLKQYTSLSTSDASFVQLLQVLMNDPKVTARKLVPIIFPHSLENYERSLLLEDYYESLMARYLEDDRLLRLLCKLEFLDDRPEHADDTAWGMSGMYYPIILFRKYLARLRVDSDGTKSMDYAHMLACLNKLDVGTEENVFLEDEFSRILVSYKELKNLIRMAFLDLEKRASSNLTKK